MMRGRLCCAGGRAKCSQRARIWTKLGRGARGRSGVERVSGAVAALPCLTIAALNGTLAGGGAMGGMALACDLRICVPSAKFFYPVMRLGFLPQPSDPARMAALIGPSRAKMILMAGAKIEAEEALAWGGLVDRIVMPDMLDEMIAGLTADACAAEVAHVAGIKAMIG